MAGSATAKDARGEGQHDDEGDVSHIGNLHCAGVVARNRFAAVANDLGRVHLTPSQKRGRTGFDC